MRQQGDLIRSVYPKLILEGGNAYNEATGQMQPLRWEISVFCLLSFCQNESVFIFQFLNVKMYNYDKQNIIVNFIINT